MVSASNKPEKDISSSLPASSADCQQNEEHPLSCADYHSTSGKDSQGEITWLASTPIKVHFFKSGTDRVLGITAPCAPINAHVAFGNGTMTVDMSTAVRGASGCTPGATADHQKWLEDFLSEPVSYTETVDDLLWSNSRGSLTFRPSRPS